MVPQGPPTQRCSLCPLACRWAVTPPPPFPRVAAGSRRRTAWTAFSPGKLTQWCDGSLQCVHGGVARPRTHQRLCAPRLPRTFCHLPGTFRRTSQASLLCPIPPTPRPRKGGSRGRGGLAERKRDVQRGGSELWKPGDWAGGGFGIRLQGQLAGSPRRRRGG